MIEGKAIILGNNIDTDQIYPGKYLPITDPVEMAPHALEGLAEDYSEKLKGAIIIAGKNFGCGSSREQAAISLKYAGVNAIVAESFARIFYRNAINQGILLCQVDKKPKAGDDDIISIDIDNSVIITPSERVKFTPLPPFLLEIINRGGLIEYTRAILTEDE